MAIEERALRLVIDGRRAKQGADQAREALNQYQRTAEAAARSTDKVEKEMKDLSGAGAGLSRLQVLFATLAAAAGLRQSASVIGGFEKTLVQLRVVGGATADELERLERVSRDLGVTSEFTANTVAETLLTLAKAGLTATQSIDSVQAVMNLAASEGLNLNDTAELLVSTLSQFKLQATDSARVVDVLLVSANASTTSAEQLGTAFKFAGSFANAAGVEFETAAGALAVLADAALRGPLGGTALRGVIGSLIKPTNAAQDAIERMGLTLDDVNIQSRGLVPVLRSLRDAGFGVKDALAIFGREILPGALALVSNADQVERISELNRRAAGTAAELAAAMGDTLPGAFARMRGAINELMLASGDAGLLSVLRDSIDLARDVILALTGAEEHIQGNVAVVKALAVAIESLVIGVIVFKSLQIAIGAATGTMLLFNAAAAANPVGLVVLGVAALVAGMVALSKVTVETEYGTTSLGNIWAATFNRNLEILQLLIDAIKGPFKHEIKAIELLVERIPLVIGNAAKTIIEALASISQGIQGIGVVTNAVVQGLGTALIGLFSDLNAAIGGVAESIVNLLVKQTPAAMAEAITQLSEVQGLETIGSSFANRFATGFSTNMTPLMDDAGTTSAENFFDSLITGIAAAADRSRDDVARILSPEDYVKSILTDAVSRSGSPDSGQQVNELKEQLALINNEAAELGVTSVETSNELSILFQTLETEIDLVRRFSGDTQALNEQRERSIAIIQVQALAEAQYGANTNEAREAVLAYTSALDELAAARRKSQGEEDATKIIDVMERERELLRQSSVERRHAGDIAGYAAAQEKIFGENTEGAAVAVEGFIAKLKILDRETELKNLFDGVGEAAANSLGDAIYQVESLEEALESLAKSLSRMAFDVFVQAPFKSAISSFLGGIFLPTTPNANGNMFEAGRIKYFDKGGFTSGPEAFPMTGGIGVRGEAGTELVAPAVRGPDGKMGVGMPEALRPLTINVNVKGGMNRDDARRTGQQVGRAVARTVRGV